MTEPTPGDAAHWEAHWPAYGAATELNPGQLYRRRTILRLLAIAGDGGGATVLDIGCGAGDLLAALAARFPGAGLAGVDQSRSGLDACAHRLPGATFRSVDLEADGEPIDDLAGWASHAVCSEVLEHVDDPGVVLGMAARFLKPGGRLVVTVPGGPRTAFDRLIGHRRHFTAADLRALLERAGFSVELAAGAGFPMFNLYRLVVLLRGERLAEDVAGRPGPLARAVMAAFRALMGLTLLNTPWGWQIVAVARRL